MERGKSNIAPSAGTGAAVAGNGGHPSDAPAPDSGHSAGLARARRHAAWAVWMLYIIVITGVTVRLTGSGLGCPDWPTCEGLAPVSENGIHGAIEFTNRMVALPTLAATLLALMSAWRVRPRRRDLRIGALLVVAAVLGNIALGALTIFMELDPRIVSMHFMLSMASIAAAIFTLQAAGHPMGTSWIRGPRARTRVVIAGILLLTVLVTIAGGVLTTASGPHSGGSADQVIERVAAGYIVIQLHVRAAYTFLALVALVWWLRRRAGESSRDLGLLLGLVVVQITLGEIQYRTGLPRGIVLAHVATGTAIWLQTCRIAAALATMPAAAIPPGADHDDTHRHTGSGPHAQRRFRRGRSAAGPERPAGDPLLLSQG